MFVKCTIKKCRQSNNDVNFALLQIRSTPIGTGIPSPAMLLFNKPIRVLLPQIVREAINVNKDDGYYNALKSRQETYTKNNDAHKDLHFCAGSTVAVYRKDGAPWIHEVIVEGKSDGHQG